MRLKSVVWPAPLGPMMALTEPRGTEKLTPPTAWKPSKLLRSSRTSSTRRPPREPAPEAKGGARDPSGKDEEKHDEDGAEDEGPVLRVRDDLLVEPEEHEGAQGGTEEGAHASQERHDQHLGGLGPVGEVREDASVEDTEEAAGEAREGARDDEGAQLVAPHVDPDELRALRVLADGREHAPEGRAHDAAEEPQAEGDHQQGEKVEVLRRPIAEKRRRGRHALEPGEIRVGDLRHALLPARDLVPLEADRPHDLGEGQREHGEVDAGQAHTEEAEDEGEEAGQEAGGGEGEEKGGAALLHQKPGGVRVDPEGEDLAVDEGPEKGPPEGAEPSDDHDNEGLDDDFRVHAGDDGPHGRDESAAEPAEKRGEHEHARVQRLDVDAEGAQGLAIQGRRADESPDARALEHVPEPERDGGAEQDDEEVVVGDGRSEDAHGAREAGGAAHRFLLRAPDDLGDIAQDEDEGIREEELVQLLLAVETLEEEALDDAAEEGDPRGCPQRGYPEGDGARAQPLNDLIGRVRAQHVEGAVGEVEHAKNAEDEREAGRDEKEEHRRGEAAQGLREGEGEVGH